VLTFLSSSHTVRGSPRAVFSRFRTQTSWGNYLGHGGSRTVETTEHGFRLVKVTSTLDSNCTPSVSRPSQFLGFARLVDTKVVSLRFDSFDSVRFFRDLRLTRSSTHLTSSLRERLLPFASKTRRQKSSSLPCVLSSAACGEAARLAGPGQQPACDAPRRSGRHEQKHKGQSAGSLFCYPGRQAGKRRPPASTSYSHTFVVAFFGSQPASGKVLYTYSSNGRSIEANKQQRRVSEV